MVSGRVEQTLEQLVGIIESKELVLFSRVGGGSDAMRSMHVPPVPPTGNH